MAYSSHLFTPEGDRLHNIIKTFRNITSLPNIAGAIHGSHIPLTTRPTKCYNPMPEDFFNQKKFHSIVLQGVCDANMRFWNVCAGQLGGVHDAAQFVISSVAAQLSTRQILARPVVHLSGMDVKPYLIGDSAYSSRPYLLKKYKLGNPAMVDQNKYISFFHFCLIIIYRLKKGLLFGVPHTHCILFFWQVRLLCQQRQRSD
jgi:hypothetical protein